MMNEIENKIPSVEYYGHRFSSKIIPSVNPSEYDFNVLLCEEDDTIKRSIILSSEDCIHFCNHYMRVANNIDTLFGSFLPVCYQIISDTGNKTINELIIIRDDFVFKGPDGDIPEKAITIDVTVKNNGSEDEYDLHIPHRLSQDICNCILDTINNHVDI